MGGCKVPELADFGYTWAFNQAILIMAANCRANRRIRHKFDSIIAESALRRSCGEFAAIMRIAWLNLAANFSAKFCIVSRILKPCPVEANDVGGGQVSEAGHMLGVGTS